MTDFINLQLPVGRIVWGNPIKGNQKKNYTTKEVVVSQKTGQPVTEWACGIAIPKDQYELHVKPILESAAFSLYPNGVPHGFSWKVTDGDSVDQNGNPYSAKTGYAGHMVLKISTEAFAPPMYRDANGAWVQLTETEVKTGDFVIATLQVKAHNNNSGGIYLNPSSYAFVGYGEEIRNTPSPDQVYGNLSNVALPPGASATPIAPAAAAQGIPAGQPTPTPVQGVPQQMPGVPPQQPVQQPAPAQPVQQPVPAQPVQQPAPAQPVQQPATLPPHAADYPAQGNAQPVQSVQPQQPSGVATPVATTAMPVTGYPTS